jgi:hypothetical protein
VNNLSRLYSGWNECKVGLTWVKALLHKQHLGGNVRNHFGNMTGAFADKTILFTLLAALVLLAEMAGRVSAKQRGKADDFVR